ncbi:MAG: 4-hydroxy-tetrahydrodipicolinate reductase [Bacilli bacterium]|nr:4-hydroxy-tetrahydrodipicolinate reductase [Bacilli bacterium]
MAQLLRVLVVGAKGRMGQVVVQAVTEASDMEAVGGVDLRAEGGTIEQELGIQGAKGLLFNNLREGIVSTNPDVVVDFTTPAVIRSNMETYLELGIRPVVGTTGITEQEIAPWRTRLEELGLGGMIVPNFTVGAVLMMKFAAIAAKYIPHVEIIEYHHDQKVDAPSGTAIKTAEMIAKERERISQGHPDEHETWAGSRGGEYEGMRIHSVRLPGYFAHQEVIFGSPGQTLTIRHDSVAREAYMPGVLLAVRKVMELKTLIYGLDRIIE